MWTTLGGDGNLAAFQLIFNTGANNARTEAMRLTSTSLYTASGINVGIGTSSPGAKLDAVITDGTAYNSATAGVYVARVRNLFGSAGNTQALISHNCDNYSSVWNSGLVETSGGSFTGAYVWQNRTGSTTYAERMRLDSSGNLGLGVTPSAWSSLWSAEQFGQAGSLFSYKSGSNYTVISNNSYAAGGNYQGTDARYTNDGYATAYVQNNSGQHLWLNAASGTAGVGVTFTQAMTLDASGNLLIGRTSGTGANLDVYESASNDATIRIGNVQNAAVTAIGKQGASSYGATSAADAFLYSDGPLSIMSDNASGVIKFSAGGNTERARITSGGDLLVGATSLGAWDTRLTLSSDTGTTKWGVGPYSTATNFVISASASAGVYLAGTTATSWSSVSDERHKDIIEPIANAAEKVCTLRAVIGKYKADETSTRKSFLIAQDVLAVLPEAVDISNPERFGLAYSDMVPLLVAAIQEQQALINDLRARVAQLEAK
jgi:hypothetical protein